MPTCRSSPAPSAFGFELRSSTPLRFARLGGGVGRLDITLPTTERPRPRCPPLAEWTLGGGAGRARAALYRVGGAFEFWTDDVGGFRVDPAAGRIELPPCDDEIAREQRLWGIPSALCYLGRGDFPLHAAAVQVQGRALLLAAPGGHGKTTLALAFHRHGYRVLSEDLTCCRARGTPAALPGPALLRVRRDMFAAPPAGTQIAAPGADRVCLALDPERRGDGAPVPIRAVVFLRAGSREIRMEPVPAPLALPDLWALAFRLPTHAGRASAFCQLARLADAVPVWNLFRPLQPEALEPTVARLVDLR
jgi:hypothetical protein